MSIILDVSCGLFWSVTYIAAIILGFQNKTWCIPTISICMNFSWELLVVVNRLINNAATSIGFWIQFTWCVLDLGIILTWQMFRKKEKFSRRKDVLLFVVVFSIVFLVAFVGNQWEGSVFLINLAMSAEFVVRLSMDNANWTSKFVAVTKMLGTFAATLLNGVLYWNPIVLWLGGMCFILDSYYLNLVKNWRNHETT